MTPLTTESPFKELPPFVPDSVDFPDGGEKVNTARRFNNAEVFFGLSIYAFSR